MYGRGSLNSTRRSRPWRLHWGLEIPAEQLDSDNGMTTLLAKLDSVFLKEEKDRAYEAYSHFDSVTEGTIKMMRKTDNLHWQACTDLTFSSMKPALKWIFGGKMAISLHGIQRLQDAAFVTEQWQGKLKVDNKSNYYQVPTPLDMFGKWMCSLSKHFSLGWGLPPQSPIYWG